MQINRRQFALAGAAAALASGRAGADHPAAPDVVIVGAGAAGIAAAHELRAAGVSYVQVEAADRTGGRAFTETSTFGAPYDHGAHWVQNTTRNPYFERAKSGDGRFYRAPERYDIYTGDRIATAAEAAAMWAAWDEVSSAIGKAGRQGRDVSPASVSPAGDPWSKTAWFGIGPWEMGKEMEDFSCVDWWNSADSTDWYFADGYGALVAAYAAGLPVSLNTPVTAIRWGGPGVEVETPRGTIHARAVILTVSTGVLAGGGIAFDPPLPVAKQEAIAAIPMGDYNHVTLQFAQDVFGMGEDGYLLHRVGDDMEGFGALTNASGTGLAYCDVGGSFARELEQAGTAAAVDFVLGKLRRLIGSDVDRHLLAASVTAWTSDPLVRGCYASARPGGYAMRAVLRRPVAGRLFFAGEACHEDMWATVGGADLSGRDTARAVARMLG